MTLRNPVRERYWPLSFIDDVNGVCVGSVKVVDDPLVSGKRSTTLQYPINGMRLKRVSEQEFHLVMEKGKKAAAAVAAVEVPVSFVIVFDGRKD